MAKGEKVGKCPRCGSDLCETAPNSRGVVNVKCNDAGKTGCKFGGYWRHEKKSGETQKGVPVRSVPGKAGDGDGKPEPEPKPEPKPAKREWWDW